MCRLWQIGIVAAILASCAASGCVALHSTRRVEMVVSRPELAQPIPNQQLVLDYKHTMFVGAPSSVSESTDDQGRAVLPVADVDFPMRLQVGRATFDLDRETVRTGGILKYRDDQESIDVRVIPIKRTLLDRLFGFGFYGTGGAL